MEDNTTSDCDRDTKNSIVSGWGEGYSSLIKAFFSDVSVQVLLSVPSPGTEV